MLKLEQDLPHCLYIHNFLHLESHEFNQPIIDSTDNSKSEEGGEVERKNKNVKKLDR